MSIFGTTGGPCGVFAPSVCDGLTVTLYPVRAEALLRHRAPQQTTAGEILTSYGAVAPVTGQLTPNKGGVRRLVAGQVVEIAYDFVVMGVPDLQDLDRAYIDGKQVEAVAVNQFGTTHAEVQWRYLGR